MRNGYLIRYKSSKEKIIYIPCKRCGKTFPYAIERTKILSMTIKKISFRDNVAIFKGKNPVDVQRIRSIPIKGRKISFRGNLANFNRKKQGGLTLYTRCTYCDCLYTIVIHSTDDIDCYCCCLELLQKMRLYGRRFKAKQ